VPYWKQEITSASSFSRRRRGPDEFPTTSPPDRQLKARAALQGVTVAALVEQAISEFLVNHPD